MSIHVHSWPCSQVAAGQNELTCNAGTSSVRCQELLDLRTQVSLCKQLYKPVDQTAYLQPLLGDVIRRQALSKSAKLVPIHPFSFASFLCRSVGESTTSWTWRCLAHWTSCDKSNGQLGAGHFGSFGWIRRQT